MAKSYAVTELLVTVVRLVVPLLIVIPEARQTTVARDFHAEFIVLKKVGDRLRQMPTKSVRQKTPRACVAFSVRFGKDFFGKSIDGMLGRRWRCSFHDRGA